MASLAGGPVGNLTDQFPVAACSKPEDGGDALATDRATDEVDIDDRILTIIGELGQGEAVHISPPIQVEPALFLRIGRFMGEGRIAGEDRVGLFAGDADGFLQPRLSPEKRETGQVDFFGEIVEDVDGKGFLQVILDPFIIIIFQEAAAVGADDKIIMLE